MKKSLLILALAAFATAANAQSSYVLDLSKSTTPLTFNAETGAWDDTYDDDAESIDSQVFSFVHSSMSDWATWWGFTVSNSTDNQRQTDTLKFQFSNMAKGGIALNEDGSIKVDDFGAPVVSAEMPYMVGYYSAFMARRPVDMTFIDGKAYDAVGVYVNLNSYPYYCIEYGDSFARAFTNGDKYTLTIHGVAPDESEKTVDVDLASYTNGNLTINRGWMYVDLSSLGTVNELYFTMSTTDKGAYGDNTPEYFCLDKLIVKDAPTAVANIAAANENISYNRATKTVSLEGIDFAVVYDVAGNKMMTSSEKSFDISGLDAGVYIIKGGNTSLKIAK